MEIKKMNYRIKVILLALLVYWLQVLPVFSQVGINATGNNPHSSAMLDVAADGAIKGGLLIPRMTTTERSSISNPANSLLIFNTTTGCFEFWDGSSWITLQPCAGGCIPLSVGPAAGSHSSTPTSIAWNWGTVSGATAYYVNTTNNFATATNVGNTISYTQTGLSCGQNYTLYVWAQNACDTSAASTFTFSTSLCPLVTCGSQVITAVNMNVGTMINGSAEQNNNTQVEKYCYGNTPANCTTYGGLYQWAEALGTVYANNNASYTGSWATCDPCGSGGIQGICPSGYHIPTDLEWSRYEWCVETTISPTGTTPLSDFQNNSGWRGTNDNTIGPGAKLKASASNTPSWDGTNASGFTALPAGYREDGGVFYNLGSDAYFWSATERSATLAWGSSLATGTWQSYRPYPGKTLGFYIRCLQN